MYHVIKASTEYNGQPYRGKTSFWQGLEYSDFKLAVDTVISLNNITHESWVVVNSVTKEVVFDCGV